MLEHPITIRTINSLLIVSANNSKDPIQLVQQLDEAGLCVHLKNGVKYTQHFGEDELDTTIMEMFGYRQHTLKITASLWNDDDPEFRVEIHDEDKLRKRLCRILQTDIFEYNSYIGELVTAVKFLSKVGKRTDEFGWHVEVLMRDELLGAVCDALMETLVATDLGSADRLHLANVNVTYFAKPLK